MGHREHKEKSPEHVGCVVITASDTRTEETDESGQLMLRLLRERGHRIVHYGILKDDPEKIAELVRSKLMDPEVSVILVNGGTGITERDSTFEAIDGLLQKRLPGFGELFRHLSYLEIGPSAMLSRATAGMVDSRVVISVPGSTSAVRLAMEKLILPELGHLAYMASPNRPTGTSRGR
ncbi:MAG: MogA/MoaB family molybdenum cofactor biosynthesis protein [Candidatus Riflebacteria bacterium]|nr:MogA/MoaB family molybdenum cofactor biosynthesis protein [Candidatus Riflebacteria bacterium]